MKRIIAIPLTAIVAVTIFISCNKDKTPPCTNNTLAQDRSIIDSFLDKNTTLNVSFNTTHNVYYGIESPGTGSQPAADSQIVFKLETRLLNGTLVDSGTVSINRNTGAPLKLSDFNTDSFDHLIFSQLKEGGVSNVIIPSSRNGLGCNSGRGGLATIPANSQLINKITLIDVKKSQ